jgi:hypothetical protein
MHPCRSARWVVASALLLLIACLAAARGAEQEFHARYHSPEDDAYDTAAQYTEDYDDSIGDAQGDEDDTPPLPAQQQLELDEEDEEEEHHGRQLAAVRTRRSKPSPPPPRVVRRSPPAPPAEPAASSSSLPSSRLPFATPAQRNIFTAPQPSPVVGVMRVSEVPKPLAARHPVLDAPVVSWSNYDTSEVDALAANRLIVLFHDNVTDLDTGLSR